jgi:putative transposase
MQSSNWKWHLDEVFVKVNGERHNLWRAVDHEGEVLESYVTKKRDKKAALKFMKKAMRRNGSPNQIVTDKLRSYSAAAKELGCLEKQVTERWANNRVENSHLPFRRRERAMLRFRRCAQSCRSSLQSMPRFTICSTHKGHSQNAVLSS